MHDDVLIRMANQIAANFAGEPPAQAYASLADHVAKFWEPRMRVQFAAAAARHPEALLPAAAALADELRRSA